MKILGLRVREVGSFRQPVALEGLTGGLDVLAGPNEFGKSTLFRALEAAFAMPHTTKAGTARGWMVPTTGGAPTIEVDFEAAGAVYRLRKRYFTGAKASLQNLDGSLLLRGADAEAHLTEVLNQAGGGHGRLGLLWVGQRKALDPLELDDSARDGLKGLIADEVSNAVSGGAMDAVRRKVAERLGALVTSERRLPKGPHKEASDLFARLTREAGEQREAVARGRERLERLGGLRVSHTALTDTEKRRSRSDRVQAARAALEGARAAADKRRAAEATWQRAEGDKLAAAKVLADFDRHAADVAKIASRHEASAAERNAQAAAAAAHALKLAEARSALDRASAAEQSARADLDAARRQQAARTAQVEFEGLRTRTATVESLVAQLVEAESRSAAHPQLAAQYQKAEAEHRTMEALQARHAAATVGVRIEYDKGGHGKIVRDGVAIAANAELALDRPAELVVSGVGRITISPAAVADASAVAKQLAKAETTFADLLAQAAVASLADLATRVRAQASASAERDRLAARLDGLCPEGLPALRQRLARAAAAVPPTPPLPHKGGGSPAVGWMTSEPQPPLESPPPVWGRAREGGTATALADLAALETSVRTAELARQTAAQSSAKLQAEQQALELAAAKLNAEAAMLTERHSALLAQRHPDETATDHRNELDAACQSASARARETVLALQALREQEPDAQRLAALEAALAAALAADAQAAADINRLDKDMAGLESLLERDALDGIAEKLAETEEALAVAARALDRVTAEIAALDMLEAQLSAAERDTRNRYLAPVTARLAPYLGLVLPGAELDLGEAFDATGLKRDGRSEAMARLSDGTREQIAVLVRLGLGRLLADTGYPLPLILDDALVYSDDARIAASFAALEKAAASHQVIVLTCRAKAFGELGGARLMLEPWKVADE